MISEVAVTRPRSGRFALAVHEANPCESVPTQRERVDAEQVQLTQRSWRECVAACLVPSDRPLLDDGDVVARPCQPCRDGRSGRTAADDEDVGVQGACRQPADAGEPGMASGPIGVISTPPIVGASGEV